MILGGHRRIGHGASTERGEHVLEVGAGDRLRARGTRRHADARDDLAPLAGMHVAEEEPEAVAAHLGGRRVDVDELDARRHRHVDDGVPSLDRRHRRELVVEDLPELAGPVDERVAPAARVAHRGQENPR